MRAKHIQERPKDGCKWSIPCNLSEAGTSFRNRASSWPSGKDAILLHMTELCGNLFTLYKLLVFK